MLLADLLKEIPRELTEEHKKKISEAKKGKKLSEEHKRKISEAKIGNPLSEEHKMKISKAKLGKNHSNETKMKMSEAKKGMNHPRAKYTLWNVEKCHYNRSDMHGDSPARCFVAKYNGKRISIGMNMDFVTCELIHDLIDEEVKKNEIK